MEKTDKISGIQQHEAEYVTRDDKDKIKHYDARNEWYRNSYTEPLRQIP